MVRQVMMSALIKAILFLLLPAMAVAEEGLERTVFGSPAQGSEDGVIPAWTGGIKVPPEGYQRGNFHINPYPEDQPLFVINKDNLEAYAEDLTAGQMALFEHYPDTFRMRIYPSRRSHRLPDWVMAGTEKNRRSARLVEDGNGISGLNSGIPFPDADQGIEIIWNHLNRFRGTLIDREEVEGIVREHAKPLLWRSKVKVGFPPYRREKGDYRDDILLYYTSFIFSPPNYAGGGLLVVDTLNQARQPRLAWTYDPNRRRIQRFPHVEYDSPAALAENLRFTDDTDMLNGAPDYYEWTNLGLEQRWIAYNNYAIPTAETADLLTAGHINPDLVRWERHWVWKVEARLKPDRHHGYKRRVLYVDADSWGIALAENYTHDEELWRLGIAHMMTYYEVPMTFTVADVHHDFKERAYNINFLIDGKGPGTYDAIVPGDSYFQPARLRQRAVR